MALIPVFRYRAHSDSRTSNPSPQEPQLVMFGVETVLLALNTTEGRRLGRTQPTMPMQAHIKAS